MVNSSVSGLTIASIWQPYAMRLSGTSSATQSPITAIPTTPTSAESDSATTTPLQSATAFQQMSTQLQSMLLQLQDTGEPDTTAANTNSQSTAGNGSKTGAESVSEDPLQTMAGQFAQSLANDVQNFGSTTSASSNSPSPGILGLVMG